MTGAKVKTVIVASMAIVAMFAATLVPMGESDATVSQASSQTTTGLGEFNIYFMIDSHASLVGTETADITELSGVQSGWVGFKGDGSDGYIATMDVLNDLGFTSSSYDFDTDFITQEYDEWSQSYYTTNNVDYGAFSKILDLENDTMEWHTYIYDGAYWIAADMAIGIYQPYNDWVAEYQTANIAFYYGSGDAIAFPGTIMPITTVPTSGSVASNYAVSFTFQYPGVVDGNPAVITDYATGYGSNAWAALKNALNLDSQNPVVVGGEHYYDLGWISVLKGLSTQQVSGLDTPDDWTDDQYKFWSLYYYDSDASTPGYVFSQFTTGFYSPLNGSAQQCADFLFVYA